MTNEVYRPEDPAYLEIKNYDKTVRISTPHHDMTLNNWLDMFYGSLVSIGFIAESVLEGLKEYAEEHTFTKDDKVDDVEF